MNETVMQRVWSGQWRRLGRYAASAAVAVLLAACGGGSDSTGTNTGGTSCTRTFTDSFGNTVSCTTMRALPGAELVSGADNGGDAGAGDAGADGTGADGAPIANANIRITDVDGKTVSTTTDATGYFRVNIGGLKQPLVASVQRSNNAWRSALVEVIQPGRSAFYTLNLTGLTDLVLAEVATAAGVSGGSDAVTPSVLAANSSRVPTAVQTVNQRVSTQLQAAGINPSTFNPLTTAFQANSTGYDQVLDNVTITKTAGGSTTIDTSGGSGGLTGQWNMVVVVEGTEVDLGPVDAAAVPSSSAIVNTDFQSAISQAATSYSGDGFTITVNGNTATVVGPSTNLTITINTFSLANYSGCGSCGVGSTVSYSMNFSYTYNGYDASTTYNNLTLSGVSTIRFTRLS